MGVYRLEDLRLWQAANAQHNRVQKLLQRQDFIQDPTLTAQLAASSSALVGHIKDGFLRQDRQEMLQFLRYAVASNREVKAAFLVAEGRGYVAGAEFRGLIAGHESIARMLRRWQTTLESEQRATASMSRSCAPAAPDGDEQAPRRRAAMANPPKA